MSLVACGSQTSNQDIINDGNDLDNDTVVEDPIPTENIDSDPVVEEELVQEEEPVQEQEQAPLRRSAIQQCLSQFSNANEVKLLACLENACESNSILSARDRDICDRVEARIAELQFDGVDCLEIVDLQERKACLLAQEADEGGAVIDLSQLGNRIDIRRRFPLELDIAKKVDATLESRPQFKIREENICDRFPRLPECD